MTHSWVRITQQFVDVIVAPDGQPFAAVRPEEPIGEAVGCEACGVPMTPEFINLSCEPVAVAT